MIFCLSGCTIWPEDYYPEYESGYFKYAVKTEKDGTQKAYILELTESGLEQTVLIYPEEIEGITVYGFGYERHFINGSEPVGCFYSEKLKKFYFPTMPKERVVGNLGSSHTGYEVYWVSGREIVDGVGAIYGFNFYCSLRHKLAKHSRNSIANVTYLYNYEGNPNDGYYWVDSYDESLISFIPPEPEREGYTFDGWYKESECINKWNFETDITGKEIKDLDKRVYVTYDGIYLFAKWIKN